MLDLVSNTLTVLLSDSGLRKELLRETHDRYGEACVARQN